MQHSVQAPVGSNGVQSRGQGVASVEENRLETLRGYDVLDTPPEAAFERITRLASSYFDVPITLVSLVGAERQWFKSCYGLDRRETSRDISFCSRAIESEGGMVVQDATEDERFADNPLVTGEEHIRFYAGVPLVTPGGHALGTLCVLDTAPRAFGDEDMECLEDFAAMAMDALEQRRRSAASEEAETVVRESRREVQDLLESINDAFFGLDADWHFTYLNDEAERVLERRCEDLLGRNVWEEFPEAVGSIFEEQYRRAAREQTDVTFEEYYPPLERWVEVNAYPRDGGGVSVFFNDINARKERNAQLRVLERAVGGASDAVMIGDLDVDSGRPRITYVNEAFTRQTGYSRAEAQGRSPAFLQGPGTDGDAVKRLKEAFRSQEAARAEMLNERKDGSTLWVDVSIEPIEDDTGAMTRWVSVRRDRTEYKKAEQALAESEQRFRKLVERGSDIITVFAPDGTVQYTSSSTERLLGRVPEEIVGTNSFERMHPDDRERVGKMLQSLLQEPEGIETAQFRTRHADGSWVHLESVGRNLLGDPAVEGIVVNSRDVTERKEAEADRRESERRFHSVVEHAQDVIFQTDAEGRWTLLSPSWEAVMGYPVEESLGTSFMEYLHPEDRSSDLMDFEARAEGPNDTLGSDIRFVTKGGSARWVRVRARLLRTEDGAIQGTTGTLSDVTDSRDLKAEREARERAVGLLEAKTSFLNNMSHELRTPLASILGFAKVLEKEGTGEQQEFAGRIVESGMRLRKTLESILSLAQLDGKGGAMELEPVLVAEPVRKAVAAHRLAAEKKGLSLEVQGPAGEEARALLNEGAPHRILDNLLSIAIKFTEEGGRVTVRVEAAPQEVRIRVEDTGIGIGEDFQKKLFEDFQQESKGLGRTHEGSGLGLAITRRLVERMDGRIEVESARGEGTAFTIRFPRPAPEDPAQRRTEDPTRNDASGANGRSVEAPRVLVVEDNRNTQALVRHILRVDYEVRCAASVEEALAEEGAFDLFLIDINLAGEEDGVELLHRLRAQPTHKTVPAIAFTANAMPGDEEHYRAVGFDGYLSKPFSREELLEGIAEKLEEARA